MRSFLLAFFFFFSSFIATAAAQTTGWGRAGLALRGGPRAALPDAVRGRTPRVGAVQHVGAAPHAGGRRAAGVVRPPGRGAARDPRNGRGVARPPRDRVARPRPLRSRDVGALGEAGLDRDTLESASRVLVNPVLTRDDAAPVQVTNTNRGPR